MQKRRSGDEVKTNQNVWWRDETKKCERQQ